MFFSIKIYYLHITIRKDVKPYIVKPAAHKLEIIKQQSSSHTHHNRSYTSSTNSTISGKIHVTVM